MFGSAARLQSSQGAFRFGGQASMGQASFGQSNIGQPAPSSQPGAVDDFPPLNRTANGEMGQDRTASLMSSLGYGSQALTTSPNPQGGRSMDNGLLNALSANSGSRVSSGSEVRSPVGTRPQETRSLVAEEEVAAARQKQEGDAASASAAAASTAQSPIGDTGGRLRGNDGRNPSAGTIGGGDSASAAKQREEDEAAAAGAVQDPLAGMAPIDRWGMKGLRTLLNNPEYSAMISGFGLDLNSLGVDLNSNEYVLVDSRFPFFSLCPFCFLCPNKPGSYRRKRTRCLTAPRRGRRSPSSACPSATRCPMSVPSKTRSRALTRRP